MRAGYGPIEAVKGISFVAPEGEVTCLLGPNGAGKTTTMYALAGVLPVSQGRVVFDGRDITRASSRDRLKGGLVLVPENRLVFPDMTVHENLLAGAYLRLKGRGGVDSSLDRVNGLFPKLRDRFEQLAGTLSGGEQQMLAVARGLMSEPKMLMLDEPSIGLAPLIVDEILEIIRTLAEQGTTVLLVEQSIRIPLAVGNHLSVLQTGEIVFSGTVAANPESEILEVLHRAYLGAM
ncbi:MAG: ABC transporter ATP-binding protein [Acidimicrobiia bacterium]